MTRILAKSKPEETLQEHLQNAVDIWKIIREKYQYFIQDREFWRYSLISVAFHDFGKSSGNFQATINKEKKAQDNHIRHEFLSGMYLYYNQGNSKIDKNLWILAVLSHHKKFSEDGMVKCFQNDAHKKLLIEKNAINTISDFGLKLVNNCGYEFLIKGNLNDYFEKTDLNRIYLGFSKIHNDLNMEEEDRQKYIFYKAILNISDWVSSGEKRYNDGIEYNVEFIRDKVITKLINEGKEDIATDFNFRDFQIESKIEGDVIAIAPTGSGKTEASILWASNKKENERIIYLLPTRVTSNAIYKRLTEYFGEEYTAVIHSSAYFLRKEIDEMYEKSDYLKDKTFFKNVNICTVDQILTQGFNLGFWEIKTFNMINSRVIFDEIHLYQPYTLGLIISTIKYLKKYFGVKFYIMSATMPNKLKDILYKSLGHETKIIQDKELLEAERNEFQVRETWIDELDMEIMKEMEKSRKILIVVNTVDEAIKIYDKYKGKTKNVICYHSRFIQKDRILKENQILDLEKKNVPLVLIATQVVEVSLDIDFDILYTENAPIDAIIQRAGRINRKRGKENTKVIIFKHSETTGKYVYKNKKEILDKSFEIFKENNNRKLSERKLVEFVDEVYKNFNVEKDEGFKDGLQKYYEVQERLSFIKDNMGDMDVFTRENMNTIDVIPIRFYEEIKDLSIEEKVKYEVSIRKNKKRKPEEINGFNYLLDCEYDDEKGLVFKKEDDPEILCY